MKSAVRLQSIQEDWSEKASELESALLYNRKLWSVFLDAMAKPENTLPVEIKNNVASLGVFVLGHTLVLQREPEPDKLSILISINQELAAGLRGAP